jgi:hypothetical protein
VSVYVDDPVYLWRNLYWCHMFADDVDELHEFAQRLGLKRSWFQDDERLPHYDVTENKRRTAVRLGAVGVDRRVTYQHIKKHRQEIRRQSKG